jgi:hypothetical protein
LNFIPIPIPFLPLSSSPSTGQISKLFDYFSFIGPLLLCMKACSQTWHPVSSIFFPSFHMVMPWHSFWNLELPTPLPLHHFLPCLIDIPMTVNPSHKLWAVTLKQRYPAGTAWTFREAFSSLAAAIRSLHLTHIQNKNPSELWRCVRNTAVQCEEQNLSSKWYWVLLKGNLESAKQWDTCLGLLLIKTGLLCSTF